MDSCFNVLKQERDNLGIMSILHVKDSKHLQLLRRAKPRDVIGVRNRCL